MTYRTDLYQPLLAGLSGAPTQNSNEFRSINSIITTSTIDRASVRAVARAINGINRQTGDPNSLN
jgi:hypothetical protein